MERIPLILAPDIRALVASLAEAGGQVWLVGGWVRDQLMARTTKDIDIEVHQLEASVVEAVLGTFAPFSAVGKSFGVYKLQLGGAELDVSIPRRDSKAGPGHKGIQVVGDPYMGIKEALRRRDLTINAIACDAVTGVVEDPFAGLADLADGVIRAVDETTFVEDPLRALRAMQFAARFGFSVDPALITLCQQMPLDELPPERVWGEFQKLLLRAENPSVGTDVAQAMGVTKRLLPMVPPSIGPSLDRAAQLRPRLGDVPRCITLMVSVMLAQCSPKDCERALDALNLHSLAGFRIRRHVLQLVAGWQKWTNPSDTDLRRCAEDTEVPLALFTTSSLCADLDLDDAWERAKKLGVLHGPLPPLLLGRDLEEFGIKPGRAMGDMLGRIRERQLEGQLNMPADAKLWVKTTIQPG